VTAESKNSFCVPAWPFVPHWPLAQGFLDPPLSCVDTSLSRGVSELPAASAQLTLTDSWCRKERTEADIMSKWLPQEFGHG